MLTKIKVYACYTVKIYKKNKPQIFFQTGGRARCRSTFSCTIMPPPPVTPSLQNRSILTSIHMLKTTFILTFGMGNKECHRDA